jgi:arginyl-tRNA synthetase
MRTIQSQLEQAFRVAIVAALGFEADPVIAPSQNDKFGDYQANAAMGLAKQVFERTGQKTNPRQVAEQVKAQLDLGAMAHEVTIAGPGFINVRLSPAWMAAQLQSIAAGERLGIEAAPTPQTVVVDYSGPNVAKEMHVGHLRSTIIGDSISRVLQFQGQKVIRQNHIGDWGTQFGKVVLAIWYVAEAKYLNLSHLLDQQIDSLAQAMRDKDASRQGEIVAAMAALHQRFIEADPSGTVAFEPYLHDVQLDLPSLERVYQFVSTLVELPQARLVQIHHEQHGARTLEEIPRLITTFIQRPDIPDNQQERLAWEQARAVTLATCNAIYKRLGVQLAEPNIQDQPMVRGESFYNAFLPDVVAELKARGIARESEGAVAIFTPGFENPLIIQKSGGGFLYGTTDLAAIRYRIRELHAQRIIYTHDSRQAQHFAQVFDAAQRAGWAEGVSLEYAPFGTMLGDDGKPFKTRSGGTVKLKDLLDEAEERGYQLAKAKSDEREVQLPDDQLHAIAHAVGIGGVKYADLSKDRVSDYVFSWDKMLAMDGNTAPYLQYAYARIRSIFRKAGGAAVDGPMVLGTSYETALARHILRLGEIVDQVARELKPHLLCTYLYDLAARFSAFYENCPVLHSEEPTRTSRLALCDLAARTMALGLDLLGIEHPEQM